MPTSVSPWLCCVFLLLIGAASGPAAAQVPPEQRRTIQVGAGDRSYQLYIASSYRSDRPAPLILVFHGAGGRGLGMARHTGFSRLAELKGGVVVYPDGIRRRWNDGRGEEGADEVGFIRVLLDSLRRELSLDPRRLYATGISNGAMFSYRLACDLPGEFAAIAPVGGGVARRRGQVLSAERSVRFWAEVNGCGLTPAESPGPDRVTDGTRIRRTVYSGCREEAEVVLYTIEGGGHTWPGGPAAGRRVGRVTREIDATRLIWDFFERHRRP